MWNSTPRPLCHTGGLFFSLFMDPPMTCVFCMRCAIRWWCKYDQVLTCYHGLAIFITWRQPVQSSQLLSLVTTIPRYRHSPSVHKNDAVILRIVSFGLKMPAFRSISSSCRVWQNYQIDNLLFLFVQMWTRGATEVPSDVVFGACLFHKCSSSMSSLKVTCNFIKFSILYVDFERLRWQQNTS